MLKVKNFPRVRRFKTAKSFLDGLRISNNEWVAEKGWFSEWIFRGQSNSNLRLIPSAWRLPQEVISTSNNINSIRHHKNFDRFFHQHSAEMIVRESWRQKGLNFDDPALQDLWKNTISLLIQVYAEIRSINSFISMADNVGHSIESFDLEKDFLHTYLNNLDLEENINDQVWEKDIIALVQHHGIPTRLLDWTTQPLIAAFFAADGVANNFQALNSQITVYAYDAFNSGGRIKIKRLPRSKSTYLHAQSGLFTFDSKADKWYLEHGNWPSFEEAFLDQYKSINVLFDNEPFYMPANLNKLIKFVLPASEAGEVLRLLWLEGISRAHLMPTLDNVASALKSQMYWAEKQNPDRVKSEEEN